MRPAFGRLKVSTRLISVLLPAPEEPTRAVVEPAAARNEMRFRTSAPGTYSKLTFSKAMSPATSASGARAPSSASSVTSRRISRIRSSPARPEEHTSELQSRLHLVCRLLLEKKKYHP